MMFTVYYACYMIRVSSGRLLKKWHAHYWAVNFLVFSDDESLLIFGAKDGCVRVRSLFMYLLIFLLIFRQISFSFLCLLIMKLCSYYL